MENASIHKVDLKLQLENKLLYEKLKPKIQQCQIFLIKLNQIKMLNDKISSYMDC